MSRRITNIFACLFVLASILTGNLQPGGAANPANINSRIGLQQVWTKGSISTELNPGIVAADIDNDGKTEIAGCTKGSFHIHRYTENHTYELVWYSEDYLCNRITAADRNGDHIMELYIGNDVGHVYVIDGANYQVLNFLVTHNPTTVREIKVLDVDNDAALEIVIARIDALLIYDATSFQMEWFAEGLGGDQLAIADIEDDATPEIIVIYTTAKVLNPVQKVQKRTFGSFSGISQLSLGDVDGDLRAEIAYVSSPSIVVMDAETGISKWVMQSGYPTSVAAKDVNKDGLCEVITKDASTGNMTGYEGSTGKILWSIPAQGFSMVEAGDTDNDGVVEILWGDGAIVIGSWDTQTIDWRSDSLGAGFYIAGGDIDQDGQGEIVVMSNNLQNRYTGMISVYTGVTHQLKWSKSLPSIHIPNRMRIGQVDNDPALEIVISSLYFDDGYLLSFDGASQSLEWQSAPLARATPSEMLLRDLNQDGIDEIVVSINNFIQVFRGTSQFILYDSGPLTAIYKDMAVGDLDGNGIMDLAILTNQALDVIEFGTWTNKLHLSTSTGMQVAIGNADRQGVGELLLAYNGGFYGNFLQARDGLSNALLWEQAIGTPALTDLLTDDYDQDGFEEFALLGISSSEDWHAPSVMIIGNNGYPNSRKYTLYGKWGIVYTLVKADVDVDGKVELLLSSSLLIKEFDITPGLQNYAAYIPNTRSPARGLYGKVTENGLPAANINLELRFYNGSNWSTKATAKTSSDGTYSFPYIPKLNTGQYYYARYLNTEKDPSHLFTWHTRSVASFDIGDEVYLGDFDLVNISLLTPIDQAWSYLPTTFGWTERNATPTDNYEFNLYDPVDGNPYFSAILGHTGSYTLTSLPSGFAKNTMYAWEIWVYSPDGGFGLSYLTHLIAFRNATQTSVETQLQTQQKSIVNFEFPLR